MRNSVRIRFGGKPEEKTGASRFGGQPDVPSAFKWPLYNGKALTFLVQINCAEGSTFDTEQFLPKTGLLSFFCDVQNDAWLEDARAFSCSRVYWFDGEPLAPAAFPDDLMPQYRYPAIGAHFSSEKTLPCWDDFSIGMNPEPADEDRYAALCAQLGCETPRNASRMLGYYDAVQNTTLHTSELALRGMEANCKLKWCYFSAHDREQLLQTAKTRWQTLLQLDWIRDGAFEFMISDCGRLYFNIPDEDLRRRRFDHVWMEMQCY